MIVAKGSARRFSASLALLGIATLAGVEARAQEPPHSAELDAAIVRAAKRHGVPEHLVRRIVMRESRYNPRARNHSFWGLMQISYPTARSMGFRGTPEELLNPVTNLTYAVPYLANAFVAAGRREDAAVRLYASGYYATAKNRGVLGLLRTATSVPLNGITDEPSTQPAAVADSGGWSLFGSSAPAAEPASAPPAVPQQLAYAATPEATAALAPAQAQIQAAVAPASKATAKSAGRVADKNGDDGVAMIAGRDGTMAPPKRWQHDGGTTVIARGEQGVEQIAASKADVGTVARGHRSRKTTVFAQIEPAAPSGGDAQPTSPPPAEANASDPRAAAAQLAAAEAVGTPVAADTSDPTTAGDSPRRHRHLRHRASGR